ncbi:MFS transporter [Luteipulveratus flavus]|uniref:MFS transporter n=1 Tax=Luteipulveratus flavus TaxID=3031728 RepID=A0ABT6CBT3_9MICO|nr:MFS transporter [Luteipulveratus sp. YIM 133296]MDF8265832.1 MFS transporter [Luteipulveratus sp. YIM 133296]
MVEPGSSEAHATTPPGHPRDDRRQGDPRGSRDATRGVPRGPRTDPMPSGTGSGSPQDRSSRDASSQRPAPRRRAAAAAGRGVARGGRAAFRLTATAGRSTVRAARRASEAEGAGESGLARLIQVHAFSTAGDTAVTVGLAGTMFFSLEPGQAKTQVLLFLLLTMLPFAIVAPLIGPLLDRFRHGRRWSIGATLALRAFLCWVLAQTVSDHSSWQFPVALVVLVSSKAYLVTRSAATPRLLPDALTLVKANGRLSLAGTVGAGIGGGLAAAAATFGSEWALRVGFVLFAAGTVLAIMLPARVDSAIGEEQAPIRDLAAASTGGARRGISGDVVTALRANSGLRWLSGFLTLFLAFVVREHPLPGWEDRASLLLALVVGAAGVGNAVGTMTGALLRVSSPRVVVLGALLADAVLVVVAAVHFGVVTAVAVGLVAGISQQMGKLALDAQIQDTVPEEVRTSVFARSETLLQLSWVLGGILAVLLPTNATVGMVTAAVLLVLWTSAVIIWHTGRRIPVPAAARSGLARRRGRSGSGRRRSRPAFEPASSGRVPEAGRPLPHDRYEDADARPDAEDDVERTIPMDRSDTGRRPPSPRGPQDDDRRDRWSSRFRD